MPRSHRRDRYGTNGVTVSKMVADNPSATRTAGTVYRSHPLTKQHTQATAPSHHRPRGHTRHHSTLANAHSKAHSHTHTALLTLLVLGGFSLVATLIPTRLRGGSDGLCDHRCTVISGICSELCGVLLTVAVLGLHDCSSSSGVSRGSRCRRLNMRGRSSGHDSCRRRRLYRSRRSSRSDSGHDSCRRRGRSRSWRGCRGGRSSTATSSCTCTHSRGGSGSSA